MRGFAGRVAAPAAVLALSLLWALSGVRGELLPGPTPLSVAQLERQALPLLLFAAIAALAALLRREQWPRRHQLWNAITLGAGLFLVPAMLIYLSEATVSAYTRTVLLILVPVFAVVVNPHAGSSQAGEVRYGLAASLAAVVGALCVFPVRFPGSFPEIAGFCAVIVAAACIAAANCRANALALPGSASWAATAAVAAATAASGLLAASACLEKTLWRWNLPAGEWLWSVALELPALLLLFWLLRRLPAPRMATRYSFAPLLAVLIGMAALRPALDSIQPRTWLGLILMATAASWLLLAPESEVCSPSSALGL